MPAKATTRAASFFAGLGLLVFGTAHAADLPIYEPVAQVPIYEWSGFYLGGIVGYGWSDKDAVEVDPEEEDELDRASYDVDGVIAGIEASYFWQTSNVVLGAQFDVAWTGMSGSEFLDAEDLDDKISTDIDWMGTFTAVLGVPWERALPYIEAGGAWVRENHKFTDSASSASTDDSRLGWLLGAGLQYQFNPQWSGKIEYNYIFLGSESYNFEMGDEDERIKVDQDIQTIKAGISYRF